MIINLALNQQNAEQMRPCISDLLTQLIADYQYTKPDRIKLKPVNIPSSDSFNILEELELVTSDLRGYASQIQTNGLIENPVSAIVHLQTLRFFSIPSVGQFYFETGEEYPKLKEYLRQLDYLRLLILEYLQSSASIESTAHH
jgi:hypothetical protein